jgi:hypothetical protein
MHQLTVIVHDPFVPSGHTILFSRRLDQQTFNAITANDTVNRPVR